MNLPSREQCEGWDQAQVAFFLSKVSEWGKENRDENKDGGNQGCTFFSFKMICPELSEKDRCKFLSFDISLNTYWQLNDCLQT